MTTGGRRDLRVDPTARLVDDGRFTPASKPTIGTPMQDATPAMLDAALAYAARGWLVFPCKPNKVPHTIRGFHEATRDAGMVRAWWTRWPDAMIGVRTGVESGIAVVDEDPKNGGDSALEQLVEANGAIPETVVCVTQSGGRHFYFKHVVGFRNSAGRLGPGIDTRGDGGYVIVPPSVHESGNAYRWDGDGDPEDVPLADLPDWLHPERARPMTIPPGAGNLSFSAGPAVADGAPVAEGGRNNAAASLAGQWIQAGESVQTVLAKLRAWNKTNAVPLPDNEISVTAASVALTHQRNNPGAVIAIVDPPKADPGEPFGKVVASQPSPPPTPFPADLLEPPGFVGEIVQWMNDTAYMPQPALALANALAFFGAVVGRKVRTPGDLRTNLYCLGIGDSGCGKDHSRRAVKKICDAAGITEKLLGGEDISSDAAIMGAVYERPAILFQWDEIGHLISNMSSRYAQTHQKAIAPLLTKLFTSANTKMLGKEYANRESVRKDIDQPNVCLYGTTVPGRLFEGLTPSEVSDGFLGRMLVFISDNPEPTERDVEATAVPPGIVAMVQAWYERKDAAPEGVGNILAATGCHPRRVPFEDDAVAEMRRFRERCKTLKAEHRGTGMDAIWARAVEHANKVALVVACGCEFGSPIVSGEVASYAVRLVEYLTGQLTAAVADSIAGSDFERDLLYVLRAIKKSGATGLTQTELFNRTRRLTPKARQEILNQLVTQGSVTKSERPSPRGASAVIYRVA